MSGYYLPGVDAQGYLKRVETRAECRDWGHGSDMRSGRIVDCMCRMHEGMLVGDWREEVRGYERAAAEAARRRAQADADEPTPIYDALMAEGGR